MSFLSCLRQAGGDLIPARELDERRGFSELNQQHLTESRGKITQFTLVNLLRQRLVKNGGRRLKHVRHYRLLLAAGHVDPGIVRQHAENDRGAAVDGRIANQERQRIECARAIPWREVSAVRPD